MPERTTPIHSKSKRRFPEAEGRTWVRYPCDCEVSFQPLESRRDGSWRAAKAGNISAKGIGLILDARTERGAILSVMLQGAAERFSRPLLVRVVRAAERPGGGWQVGCTFAIPLREEELRALLPPDQALQAAPKEKQQAPPVDGSKPPAEKHDPFLQGSVNERRVFPRRRISVPVSLSYGSFCEKTHEAQAIDASLGGLKLLSGHPYGRGTILRVRSTKTPGRVPSVAVRVKSCTPQAAKWVVATEFLQPPPSEVMFYFS